MKNFLWISTVYATTDVLYYEKLQADSREDALLSMFSTRTPLSDNDVAEIIPVILEDFSDEIIKFSMYGIQYNLIDVSVMEDEAFDKIPNNLGELDVNEIYANVDVNAHKKFMSQFVL